MAKILVSGLINIEITLQVDGFPIPYFPVRYPFFGIESTVSGVGYNVAKALTTLGDDVVFLSVTGRDLAGMTALETIRGQHIPLEYVSVQLEKTPHSVILYDREGRRQINVDLKDIQESQYPFDRFSQAVEKCNLAVLCNINFSRSFLAAAHSMNIPIATDVHAVSSLDDSYNRDFMSHATILFMSNEALPAEPFDWARKVMAAFGVEILVIGMGSQGVLMAVRRDNFLELIPAVRTRPIVNTIGAGDALFSSFIHFYSKTGNPYDAITRAVVFASWKIGEKGAAEGFLDEESLMRLVTE